MNETITCFRCREKMDSGDEYYDTGDRCYCPDCWEAFSASLRRTVGDVEDRI